MLLKSHFIIIFGLFILLSIVPVSAYTLEYTYTGTGADSGTMDFHIAFWTNTSISKVVLTDVTAYCGNDNRLSGSYSNTITDHDLADAVIGNYTATWSGCPLLSWQNSLDMEIVFDDIEYPLVANNTGMTRIGLTGIYAYIKNTSGTNPQTKRGTVAPGSTYPWGAISSGVIGGTPNYVASVKGQVDYYSGSGGPIPPETSFSCTPTSQFPDTEVYCTDTSTNTPTTWLWTIDAEALGIESWQTSSSQNLTWLSHYPGWYSINLWAENAGGGSWYNRTNYVFISENATPNSCNAEVLPGYIRSYVQCMDSISLGVVSGCDIQLKDKEGGVWSNVTDRADGWWCIDTLPLHHVDAYGQADGYTSASNINLPANDAITYSLLLIPGYVPDAPDGYVYVFAKVSDIDTLYPIDGATVTAACSGCSLSPKATNTAGVAQFTVTNQTQVTFTAYKPGYISISKTITTSDVGPDTALIEMHKVIVTPTATMTTGPGGTVPTTAPPHVNPDGSYPDNYSTLQGQDMLNWLAANGMSLIQLCFVVTIVGLISMMSGKRR